MTNQIRPGGAHPRRRASRKAAPIVHGRTEKLVGTSFRYWLTGFHTGDLSYWQRAFDLSAGAFGTEGARVVCADFSSWVSLLSDRSRRPLRVLEPGAPHYGRDECVAMAVIASYQHQACPALQACALALLGCEPNRDLVALSSSVADRFKTADHMLPAHAMDHVIRHAQPGVLLTI